MKTINFLSGILTTSIVIGICHKYFYYRAFGIRILDYISLGETLLLMEELIPLFLVSVIISWIIALIINKSISEIENRNSENDKVDFFPYLNKKGFVPRLKENFKENIKGVILIIVIVPFYFIPAKNPDVEYIRHWFIFFPILTLSFMMLRLEFIDRISRIKRKSLSFEIDMVSTYAAIMIPFLISYTGAKINLVKGQHGLQTVTFKTDKEFYPDTPNTYFVGKTMDYIFYHNYKDSTTVVFSMNKINSIIYKEKK